MIPEGIVDSLWYDVVDRCEEFGDHFYPWQDGLGEATLGLRDDGMFAATVGGITLSIPRQVAKTFIVGRICIALGTLFPDLTILWTAHRTRTATKTFDNLKAVALRPNVRGYLRVGSNNGTAIRDANGEQEIPFANGSRILFGAREGGFGRGFDEVDVEVFDEAQILGEKALEDMVAATNQSRFPHGALLFYMGTPPRPNDPGEAFAERRAEALAAKAELGMSDFGPVVQHGDSVFIECSADSNVGMPGGPDLDDPRQVELANPSYPHLTPPVSVKRLRKNLPGDAAWRREGLGVWDDGVGEQPAIRSTVWNGLLGEQPDDGLDAFGVKFSGELVSLAAARRPTAGPIFVEGLRQESLEIGHDWLVEFLAERAVTMAGVVVDGKEGVGPLVADLIEAGVPRKLVTVPTVDQVITAHAGFLGAVRTHGVEHSGQPALTAEVRVAGKRKIGRAGGWGWRSIEEEGTVVTLEAGTLAWWLAKTSKRAAGGRSGGQHGRRVVNGSRRAGTVGSRVPHPQPAG